MNRTSLPKFAIALSIVMLGHAFAVPTQTPTPSKPQIATLDSLSEGRALYEAWHQAKHNFSPEVRAAFLAFVKAQTKAELTAARENIPADFIAWVDSDPIVEATVYGIKDKPAKVLRILRSLEIDLGTDVVRKQYTQLALAVAVSNADHKDFTALGINLSKRSLLKLVIPPNPLKPVNTKDPHRELDVNDHIINFLNSETLEYEVKITPAKKGDPITTEKRTRPMVGADVLASRDLQAKFNAYMKAHGQTVQVDCLTLVELLVVIAIIGMLAALIFPVLQSSVTTGRKADCENKLRQIGIATISFEARKGF